jgi:hypothetical protein
MQNLPCDIRIGILLQIDTLEDMDNLRLSCHAFNEPFLHKAHAAAIITVIAK